jgi:hypothetical protein
MRLVLVILTLLPLVADAQVFLPHRRAFGTVNDTLPCNASLKYWWVASDLADGAVSAWTDRVAGIIYQQDNAAKRPTKTANYVQFDGAHYLTNFPVGVSIGGAANRDSVFLIYKPDGDTGTQAFWVRHHSDAFGFLFNESSDTKFYWFEGGGNQVLVSAGMNYNMLYDIFLRDVGTAASFNFWEVSTNGVVVTTNSTIQARDLAAFGAGSGENNFLQGRIYEIQVYNCTLSSSDVALLHNYRLTTYGDTVPPYVCYSDPDTYIACTAVFDGSNDYMSLTSSGPGGLADGNKLTFSTWVKFNADGTWANIFDASTSTPAVRCLIRRNDNNTILVYGVNSAGAEILRIDTTDTFTVADGWVHLYACIDLSDTAKRKIYKNGTPCGLTVTTYNTGGTIDFIGANFGYRWGARVDGAGDKLTAALADTWFNDDYLDNTALFASGGDPINLGYWGETPTGTPPVFYFHASGNDFIRNFGTGGDFTLTGSLGTTTPP